MTDIKQSDLPDVTKLELIALEIYKLQQAGNELTRLGAVIAQAIYECENFVNQCIKLKKQG